MATSPQQAPAGLTPLERQRLLLRNNLITHVMCSNVRPCRYGDRCMFSHSVEESRVMRALKDAERARGSDQGVVPPRGSAAVLRTTSDAGAFERKASGGYHAAGPVARTATGGGYYGRSLEGGLRGPSQQRWGGQGQGGEAGGGAQQQQHFCPPSLYKTALCTHWTRQGECRHADACTFAHGEEELREYTRHAPYRYGHYRTSTSAGTEAVPAPSGPAGGDTFSSHAAAGEAEEAVPDELAAAYPEEYVLQQQYDMRRQHVELDRQMAAAAAAPPPPSPPPPLVLGDSEQFPSLGGAGAAVPAPTGDAAGHAVRAGLPTMAAVLTKNMSCEWEGASTTSSGAPTTACLSEPALKPEYSSGASVAGSVRSVGMAESEDGNTCMTSVAATISTAKQAQAASAAPAAATAAAAPGQALSEGQQAAAAPAGAEASLPAGACREEGVEAAVFAGGQAGASWADMADEEEEEREEEEDERAGDGELQQEQEELADPAAAAEDANIDSAGEAEEHLHPDPEAQAAAVAAAVVPPQQQQQRGSVQALAASPAAPPGLTTAASAVAAAAGVVASVKAKVASPLPLPLAPRPAGAIPSVEYRDASTSPLTAPMLAPSQPARQHAPSAPAAHHAPAYHHHHGHHTLPLPPPPPPGFAAPPSPRAVYAPAGVRQPPAHLTADVGPAGRPLLAPPQAAAQPAFMQRMSYPGTVDLSLVPAFTCPLTGHLFVNPVVAADGITYEKEVITDWLFRQNKEVSPVTGKQLAHRLLLPNDCLRSAMTQVAELMRAMVV